MPSPSSTQTLDTVAPAITYTIAEGARVLGVSRPTIYALAKRGELTIYKVGRCSRLNAAQVHALVGEVIDAR